MLQGLKCSRSRRCFLEGKAWGRETSRWMLFGTTAIYQRCVVSFFEMLWNLLGSGNVGLYENHCLYSNVGLRLVSVSLPSPNSPRTRIFIPAPHPCGSSLLCVQSPPQGTSYLSEPGVLLQPTRLGPDMALGEVWREGYRSFGVCLKISALKHGEQGRKDEGRFWPDFGFERFDVGVLYRL